MVFRLIRLLLPPLVVQRIAARAANSVALEGALRIQTDVIRAQTFARQLVALIDVLARAAVRRHSVAARTLAFVAARRIQTQAVTESQWRARSCMSVVMNGALVDVQAASLVSGKLES